MSAAFIQMHSRLISTEANTMNPDQTAPTGSILFAIQVMEILKQKREQTAFVGNSRKWVNL